MKTYTFDEMKQILAAHAEWARDYTKGTRANLYGANLEGAYLRGANLERAYLHGANLERAYLHGANLEGANLQRANLHGANLERANLERANLERANLYGANLYGANLEGAYLHGANLERANLYGANLERANLEGANLEGAYLEGAYLHGANLERANLYGANLERANLEGARGLATFQVAPEVGQFTAFKKTADGAVLTLLIPSAAKRVNAYGSRKCRASEAVVIAESKPGPHAAIHRSSFIYELGATVEAPDFEPSPLIECAPGIHFFMSRAEAEEYF